MARSHRSYIFKNLPSSFLPKWFSHVHSHRGDELSVAPHPHQYLVGSVFLIVAF